MDLWLIVVLVVVVILVLYLIGTFNRLVVLRNHVRTQWAQISVALKRRADLIPNLVETVKGYAGHEKETLEAVISARSRAVSAKGMEEEMKAAGELSGALGRLMLLTENYPELKANTNFLELQKELTETENKISYARQFYNDSVLKFRNMIEKFPSNIVASMFNFKQSDAVFFEVSEADTKVPEVKF